MDTRLIVAANPAEIETECLVVFSLDYSSNKDPKPSLSPKHAALETAAADLISSAEVSGKPNEAVLLHNPRGLKAKRLLVIGGGKAKTFSHIDLRKAAGAALRALKPKMIKSCAFTIPDLPTGSEDAVRSIKRSGIPGQECRAPPADSPFAGAGSNGGKCSQDRKGR